MTHLAPLHLEDGTVIYLEASEATSANAQLNVPASTAVVNNSGLNPSAAAYDPSAIAPGDEGYSRVGKGWPGSNGSSSNGSSGNGSGSYGSRSVGNGDSAAATVAPLALQTMEATIRSYTKHTLNAFKQLAIANVEKVTLEFGVQVNGEMGIPYVTKGTAGSNIKVTVECSFPAA